MNVLIVINGAAYGSDVTFNAVRLAGALARREAVTVHIFLMGDGVTCALAGQRTPDGYYTLDRMLSSAVRHGAKVLCCGTCLEARGITDQMLIDGARRSTMDELADLTLAVDKALVF